jgi:hypothetical protein
MSKAIRIAVGVFLALVVFGGSLYLFVDEVFRLNCGHVRTDVFTLVVFVVFVCSEFLVGVAGRQFGAEFSRNAHRDRIR